LKKHDPVARTLFYSRLSIYDGDAYPQLLFLSDEAWLSLCGEVKSQSSLCWSAENPGIVYEIPLRDEKFVVWFTGKISAE
jgi:hypothetical protein